MLCVFETFTSLTSFAPYSLSSRRASGMERVSQRSLPSWQTDGLNMSSFSVTQRAITRAGTGSELPVAPTGTSDAKGGGSVIRINEC